jgi:hypothetical protein
LRVLARQARRRRREHAKLGDDPVLAELTIGGGDAIGDGIELVELGVIVAELGDFLPALLVGDVARCE